MKRVLKNNIGMLVMLSLAGAIALALLVLVVIGHFGLLSAKDQAENYRNKISELIKQRPAPVRGNIELISQDREFYTAEGKRLFNRFGNVFEKPLEVFYKTLGVSEEEFQTRFRELWETQHGRDTVAGRYEFKTTVKREPRWAENWNKAQQAFNRAAAPCIVEKIQPKNGEEILFSALGLKREMSGQVSICQEYMNEMRGYIETIFKKKNVELGILDFGFPATEEPRSADIPYIVKQFDIISDICRTVSGSGVKMLERFGKRTLRPQEDGDYRTYHYTFEVIGSMESIRNLYLLLNQSVERNRFYVVQSVYLYSDSDRAGEIFADDGSGLSLLKEFGGLNPGAGMTRPPEGMPSGERRMGGRRRGRMTRQEDPMMDDSPQVSQEEAQKRWLAELREREARERKLPYFERSTYGRVLFGGSDMFRAVFDVEYVERADRDLN